MSSAPSPQELATAGVGPAASIPAGSPALSQDPVSGDGVKVLIADGQALTRDVLFEALREQHDLRVVAVARDGPMAVAEASRTEPDVAVVDADLPGLDGVRVTRLIRERLPNCRVLLLAAAEDPEVLAAGIEAGARAYLTKASPLADLVDAISSVSRGETLVPSALLGDLLDRLIRNRQRKGEAARRVARLTPREHEVLALLAEGGDNESIARALVISPQTARTHIQNLLMKLGVHSRLEAAAVAIQLGIVGR